MDFEFTADEQAFAEEVAQWLQDNHSDDVMQPWKENFTQLCDTDEKRAFMGKLSKKGWMGITWPKELGGQEGSGIYEYLLNEALAYVGAPQIGKGIGIIGKTLIRHGSDKLKQEFLPKILNAKVEFAVGYSEPQAGSDAANMQLRADKVDGGWNLNGQKIWTTSAHFADWYWVGARTNQEAKKHAGISLFLIPMDEKGLEIQSMPCIGGDQTNQVFFNDVFVPDEYMVGEEGKGFGYISEALDLERFTMFTFSPIWARFELLLDYVKSSKKDGEPCKNDPVVRREIAQLATQHEVARVLGLRFVAAAKVGDKPPTLEASQYKLFATQLSQRSVNKGLDIMGAEGQIRLHDPHAPEKGRFDSAYRATVVETIGGGASEIQKNIIARRGLGLPKNF